MGGAEAGDFDVDEVRFEAGGADVGFGDGRLAFWVDDPQGGGAAHGFGERRKPAQIFCGVRGEENPWGIFREFVLVDYGGVFFEAGEEIGGKFADEGNEVAGLDAEFVQKRFGICDFFTPFGGLGAESKYGNAIFGADVEFAIL